MGITSQPLLPMNVDTHLYLQTFFLCWIRREGLFATYDMFLSSHRSYQTKMIWRPDGWNCPKTRQILIDFSILSWKPVSGALQVSTLESKSLLSSELDLMLTSTLILLNSKAIFLSHSTSSTDCTTDWTLGERCNVCFAGSLLCTKTASGESFSCAK